MSPEAFLEWGLLQDQRYELVDGAPVATTGAKVVHDRIVTNAHGMLYARLRGKPCRNFTADIAVRIPAGNIRRPDVGVDCGAYDPVATSASAPFLVLEVLSPSTRDFDLVRKLEEYKTIPCLAHIILIESDFPQVNHWSRSADGLWLYRLLEGRDGVIPLPEIEASLDVASLYEGISFPRRPRLVWDEGQP